MDDGEDGESEICRMRKGVVSQANKSVISRGQL